MSGGVDIATLGLEIRSDGVVVASNRLREFQQQAGKAEKGVSELDKTSSKTTDTLKKMAAALITVFAVKKLEEYIVSITRVAGRYDMMGVAMYTAGKNAGYTAAQMDKFENGLKRTGIAAIEARQSITRLAVANVNLEQSALLARAAQDLAVVGGLNSSEAFERMATAIQKGQVITLHALGINATFEQGYEKMKKSLGGITRELTENEKVQSRVNTVLEAAAKYQGIYEAAMGSAEKQFLSLERHVQTYEIALGKAFQPAYLEYVKTQTEIYKKLTEAVSDPEFQTSLKELSTKFMELYQSMTSDILDDLPKKIQNISDKITAFVDAFNRIPDSMVSAGTYGLIGTILFGKEIGLTIAAITLSIKLLDKMANSEAGKKLFDDASNHNYIPKEEATAPSLFSPEQMSAWKAQSDAKEAAAQAELKLIKDGIAAQEQADIQKEEAIATAKKSAEQYKKASEELEFQIRLLGETEREQYALNQVKAHGLTEESKLAAGVKATAYAYYDQKQAMEEVQKVRDKFIDFMSLDDQAATNLQKHNAELEVQKDNLKSMTDYTVDFSKNSSSAADQTETAWVKAAENIQDAWANLLTDILTGELQGIDDYAEGLGKAFASSFSNTLMAGMTEGMKAAQAVNGSALSGAMSGAAASFNPYMLAGSVAMMGASALMGDSGPSYGERLASAIEKQIKATEANTQSILDQIRGTSDLEIANRELKDSIFKTEVEGTSSSLAEGFKIPAGMKKRSTDWMDAAISTGINAAGAFFAPATGGQSVAIAQGINAGIGVGELNKGYTSFDYGKEDTGTVIKMLFDTLTQSEFFKVMQETTNDPGALIRALDSAGLLNPNIPGRVEDYYSGGSSKADRNSTVAEGIVASMTESFAKIDLIAANTADSIDSYMKNYDDSKLSSYGKAFVDIEDSLGKDAEAARKLLIEIESMGENSEATAAQIATLTQAEADLARVRLETEQKFAAAREKTMAGMQREMDITSGKYTTSEQTNLTILDQAEEYRLELVDQGMSYEEAGKAVTKYARTMMYASAATQKAADDLQKAADKLQIKGITGSASDVITMDGMSNLDKSLFQINKRYREQFETLTKLGGTAEDRFTLGSAMNIELRNAKESAYNEIKDFYDTLKEKVSDLLWDLKGGSLAPVQSQEMMNARYNELYAGAMESGNIDKFTAFVSGDFATFAKGFGNWSQVSARIVADVEALQTKYGSDSAASLADVTGELSTANTSLAEIVSGVNTMNQMLAGVLGTNGFAAGGYPRGLSIVGERGMELINTNSSRVFSNQDTMSLLKGALSGRGSTNVTVKVYLPDGSEFKKIIANTIETDTETQYQVKRAANS